MTPAPDTLPSPTWIKRSCSICEASCGLRIQVDPAAKQILRVEGDDEDSRSQGFVCAKSQAMLGVYHDPERLRRPLRKCADGSWEEIDWDTALDTAVSHLLAVREQHGHEALGVYIGNPTGFDVGAMLYSTHFMRALMTTHVFTAATLDHFPKMVSSRALYGRNTLLPVPDIDRCDYFLCLGGNPLVSQGSLMSAPDIKRRLRAIQQRGGRIVVFDPRRSETAAVADEHHFIRPGTDALLLAAMAQVVIDEGLVRWGHLAGRVAGFDTLAAALAPFTPEAVASATGVDAATTRRLAREFADAGRACCYGRIGTCTTPFGTLASALVDVLGILTGHLDSEGGMMFPRPHGGELEGGKPLPGMETGRWHSAVRGLPEIDGQLPAAALAEEIDAAGERRVRALITLAGNPVLSCPNGERLDHALGQLDFMLCIDIYLNETTRHADLILPPLSLLECETVDALAAGTTVHNFARWSPAVLAPDPAGMPQWRILLELAARLNGGDAATLDAALLRQQAQRTLARPGSPAHGQDVETVLAQLGPEPGPLRLVDLMLRGGPYGDGFDAGREGLSLARLRAANGPVDLGPLQPRLLEILRTEDGCIQLAHPYLMADLPRLEAELAHDGASQPLRLIGRRQPRNMNSWLHNLPQLAKGRPRCVLLMHPVDAAAHGINAGDIVSLSSRVGTVRVPVELTEDIMPGVASLPHGFGHSGTGTRLGTASSRQPGANANALTDELALDPLSGTCVLNGIPVTVSAVSPG